MLSRASILYGAALSAALAGAALAILARRATQPATRQAPHPAIVIVAGMLASAAGPIAWNQAVSQSPDACKVRRP